MFHFQAVCEWGHESVESWGRRKRDLASNGSSDSSENDDMTLSQEILVLDFGDEKTNDFLQNEASFADYSKGKSQQAI